MEESDIEVNHNQSRDPFRDFACTIGHLFLNFIICVIGIFKFFVDGAVTDFKFEGDATEYLLMAYFIV